MAHRAGSVFEMLADPDPDRRSAMLGMVQLDIAALRGLPRDCGGRTRTRTLDPLIKSQLLYQLSYAPDLLRGAPRAPSCSKAPL